jgi:hypothetical protein
MDLLPHHCAAPVEMREKSLGLLPGSGSTGGAGRLPIDTSTDRDYSFVVSRTDLAELQATHMDISRRTLLELLPIRLSCRYTEKEWWSTLVMASVVFMFTGVFSSS